MRNLSTPPGKSQVLGGRAGQGRGLSQVRERERGERIEVRDQRGGGWFWAHNEFIDRAAHLVGPIAGAIYMSLARHANQVSQASWPSLSTLAREWGISRPTVCKAIKILEEYGLIKVERHPEAARRHIANIYILTHPSTWKLPADEREQELGLGEGVNQNQKRGRGQETREEVEVAISTHDSQRSATPSQVAGAQGLPVEDAEQDKAEDEASKRDLPGLVNEVNQPSKRDLPQQDSSNKTYKNKTHHDEGLGPSSDTGKGRVMEEGHDEGGADDDLKRKLLELLAEIGDDNPKVAIAQALSQGWSLDQLLHDVKRLSKLNGRIKNKAGLLRKLIPCGRAKLLKVLRNYELQEGGESASMSSGGADVVNLQRILKRRYESLLAEFSLLQEWLREDPYREDFKRRLRKVEQLLGKVRRELEGIDPGGGG